MKKLVIFFLTLFFFTSISEKAFAEKVCLRVAFNKKKGTISTTKAIAPTCPKGFTELIDTATLVGPQGPAGKDGINGSNGKIDLSSCRYEGATFAACPEGSMCTNTLQCGGAGTTQGSAVNDYMIHYDWALSNNAAYVTESNPLLTQGAGRYPTGIMISSASETGFGSHTPSIGIVCCLAN